MENLPNQVTRDEGAQNPMAPVIIMVPAPTRKQSYGKTFPKHPNLELGLIQLLMALLAIITQMVGLSTERPDAHYSFAGFWCGILFGVSGVFGILASVKQSLPYIITLLVLSIIASVFCLPFLWIASIGAAMSSPSEPYDYHDHNYPSKYPENENSSDQNITKTFVEKEDAVYNHTINYDYFKYDKVKHAMFTAQIFISLIQAVTSIATSAMTCKAICGCCKSSSEDGVVYYANNGGGQANSSTTFQQAVHQRSGFISIPLTNIQSQTQSDGASAMPIDTFIPTTNNCNNNTPPPNYEAIARNQRLQRFYSIDLKDQEEEALGTKPPLPE